MTRPALPLSVQLLLTFVGLLVGITSVLTRTAYTSLRYNLEEDAHRAVSAAARNREQSVSQLFQLRQQHAETFLASVQSMCTEPLGSGRVAWLDDCIRPMLDQFRRAEHAMSAVLASRTRQLRRSGPRLPAATLPPSAVARVVRGSDDDAIRYFMRATRGELTLALHFDHQEVARLFAEPAALGPGGEVLLIDFEGNVLAGSRAGTPAIPAESGFLNRCRTGADGVIDLDHERRRAFQSFRPVAALGTACVAARADYDQTVAPAEQLRRQLVASGAWFVAAAVVLSLVAAHWIAAPVRRLAQSARKLQTGRFDRPIPLSGPSEVRALGRAFNAMGNDLAELVAREQTARREAEAANRAKDEFLATVSHELRTPLTAILGWAHMLRHERLPPEGVQQAIRVIERSARAQRHLIEDLLDVSRIVSNRLHIAREPVRLAEVIEAAVETVKPQARAQNIAIEMNLAESATVVGDSQRLEQVVWNLVWNAVKFTQPSGRVSVTLACEGHDAVLTVADTGVGISKTFLPHVFDWFRQADARSRSQSGLGLGLGIVRHIVRLHGGKVRAESHGEGQGATFVVLLPLHEARSAVAGETSRAALPLAAHPSLNDVRVLLVEDDEDTRELVRLTLEKAGASVDAVASADEARRELSQQSPHVLISDIRMPEENGYSLMQSLRKSGFTTPAIALTALARREDADAAQAAGFQLHMPKPIDAPGLIDAVARLARNHTVH